MEFHQGFSSTLFSMIISEIMQGPLCSEHELGPQLPNLCNAHAVVSTWEAWGSGYWLHPLVFPSFLGTAIATEYNTPTLLGYDSNLFRRHMDFVVWKFRKGPSGLHSVWNLIRETLRLRVGAECLKSGPVMGAQSTYTESRSSQHNIHKLRRQLITTAKHQVSIFNTFSGKKGINSAITCRWELPGKDFKIAILIMFSGAKGHSTYICKEKLGHLNKQTEQYINMPVCVYAHKCTELKICKTQNSEKNYWMGLGVEKVMNLKRLLIYTFYVYTIYIYI